MTVRGSAFDIIFQTAAFQCYNYSSLSFIWEPHYELYYENLQLDREQLLQQRRPDGSDHLRARHGVRARAV